MHVVGRVSYFALVKHKETIELNGPTKLEQATNIDEWTALKQFSERIAADLKTFGIVALAIAETQKAGQWVYRQAFARVSMEVAAGLAASNAGLRVDIIHQKTAAATLGIDYRRLPEQLAAQMGMTPARGDHWKERAPALASALHVAKALWT